MSTNGDWPAGVGWIGVRGRRRTLVTLLTVVFTGGAMPGTTYSQPSPTRVESIVIDPKVQEPVSADDPKQAQHVFVTPNPAPVPAIPHKVPPVVGGGSPRKPTPSASAFLSGSGGKLLIVSVVAALLPLVLHGMRQHARGRRRRIRNKAGARASTPAPVADGTLKARLGIEGTVRGPVEKVPPRPRSPVEEAPPKPVQHPEVVPPSTSDHLFATARTSLDLLRRTPDDLKQPVIDQLSKILDALQAEFEHRRRLGRHQTAR